MQDFGKMLASLRDLVSNPTPRVPVALCLDVSSSMKGDSIRELNAGVQQYIQEIRNDDMTLSSAETAVITFSNRAELEADFNTADLLAVPELKAGGMTAMGEGVMMALDRLENRKAQYRNVGVDYYQPILVVMSDGFPNGDRDVFASAVNRIRDLVDHRRLTVIAVGIGDSADMVMLSKLSPKQKPVRLSNLQFWEFFAWLSQSVALVSASTPDYEPEMPIAELEALQAEPWSQDSL